jgi:hypothetical protein
MAALTAALLGLSVAEKVSAQRKQGEYEAHQNEVNASLAEESAADALARGGEDEARQRCDTRGLIGSQRAGYAAQGVQVDNGSALDIVSDSARQGELDALTIRTNAAREAHGFTVEALNDRAAAEQARSASRSAARTTLLGGAAQLWAMGSESGTFDKLKNKFKRPPTPKGTTVPASSFTDPRNYG